VQELNRYRKELGQELLTNLSPQASPNPV